MPINGCGPEREAPLIFIPPFSAGWCPPYNETEKCRGIEMRAHQPNIDFGTVPMISSVNSGFYLLLHWFSNHFYEVVLIDPQKMAETNHS